MGALRVNGGTTFTNLQAGQAQMAGGSSSVKTNITITFPKAFPAAPKVVATAHNDPSFDVDDTFAVTVRKVTTTNCVLNIVRLDAGTGWSQLVRVDWMAWQ